MTKSKQELKWRPAFTVRLEPELHERLRNAAHVHRVKKQPLLRDAIHKLLERENTHTPTTISRKWVALAANQPATTMPEAVILTPDQDEALRDFCHTYRIHKQTVTRQALIEYLDALEDPRKLKRSAGH